MAVRIIDANAKARAGSRHLNVQNEVWESVPSGHHTLCFPEILSGS